MLEENKKSPFRYQVVNDGVIEDEVKTVPDSIIRRVLRKHQRVLWCLTCKKIADIECDKADHPFKYDGRDRSD